MVRVQRCPRCAVLTMLMNCPSCRTDTVAYLHLEDSEVAREGIHDRLLEDCCLEDRSGILARQLPPPHPTGGHRYAQEITALLDSLEASTPTQPTADEKRTVEELAAELQLFRQNQKLLLTHLEELAKANVDLADQLQSAKDQMLLSAADVRHLCVSNKRIRNRQVREVEQLLQENSFLQQQQRELQQPCDVLRGSGRALSVKSSAASQSGRHRSHSNDHDGASCVSEALSNAELPSRRSRDKSDYPNATPISIVVESTPQAVAPHQKGREDEGEIARLRRALREREEQLRYVIRRAHRAESVIKELTEGLDEARELADEGDRALSLSSPYAAHTDSGDGEAGVPSAVMRQHYEDLLARQGMEPYSRESVGGTEIVGYNGRALPSSYSPAEATRQRSARIESLVS